MKLLILSDTHRITYKLEELLESYSNQVDYFVHLGDYANDLLKYQSKYPKLKMIGIPGAFENGDVFTTLEINGARLLFTHGHTLDVKSNMLRIVHYALEQNVDACFFGHTHVSVVFEESGVLFINPGSLCSPKGGTQTGYAMVTVSPEGKVTGELVTV